MVHEFAQQPRQLLYAGSVSSTAHAISDLPQWVLTIALVESAKGFYLAKVSLAYKPDLTKKRAPSLATPSQVLWGENICGIGDKDLT